MIIVKMRKYWMTTNTTMENFKACFLDGVVLDALPQLTQPNVVGSYIFLGLLQPKYITGMEC